MPREVKGRGLPYRVTTKYSFYPVHTNKTLKSGDFMTNYLPIRVWRPLPCKLTSPVKCSPRTEGPSLCSISQGLHMAHKKTEYEYGLISYLLVKKIASKWPVYLSIDALLPPPLRIVWGFLSDPRVLLHCWNDRLEYYAARDKPLWRHNTLSDAINTVTTEQTSERTLSDRCVNNVLERCQSNCLKLCRITCFFYENQVIRICRPCRLYRGHTRAMYWIDMQANTCISSHDFFAES